MRLFDRFATGCARFTGRPLMFGLCVALCVAGIAAYAYGSDHLIGGTSLAINIVTLLILPILQATQNRDGAALQAKIDELIKSSHRARDTLIGLENRSEEEIEALRNEGGPGCDPAPLPQVTGRI
jgi:low affinity Fe/Cu permease